MPITPGNMAMKIFQEQKLVEAATPDQSAMKKIFEEKKASVPITPGNAAMKIFREEKEADPMTPDQAAMKARVVTFFGLLNPSRIFLH